MLCTLIAYPGTPPFILNHLDQGLALREIGALVGDDPALTAPPGVDAQEWVDELCSFVADIDGRDPAESCAAIRVWVRKFLPDFAAGLDKEGLREFSEGLESMI